MAGSSDSTCMAEFQSSGDGCVDRDNLLEIADGDLEFVREIAETFSEDALKRLSAIRDGIASDDLELIAREAHALKGAVSNFAVPAAQEAMSQVEQIGKSGSADGLRDAWEIAERQILAVVESLKAIIASL